MFLDECQASRVLHRSQHLLLKFIRTVSVVAFYCRINTVGVGQLTTEVCDEARHCKVTRPGTARHFRQWLDSRWDFLKHSYEYHFLKRRATSRYNEATERSPMGSGTTALAATEFLPLACVPHQVPFGPFHSAQNACRQQRLSGGYRYQHSFEQTG